MGFYDLTKEERAKKVADIQYEMQQALQSGENTPMLEYFNYEDTYIRKAAYLGMGRIYNQQASLRTHVLQCLTQLKNNESEFIRQTVINAAGEIGTFQFEKVVHFFDEALFDAHHRVRNAVIGSLKKMGQKNPKPTLSWAKGYLHHPDKEVRREICHGIELRGRTHPEDILPLLETLQHDETRRVRDTLVHVIGQISYKKGCLPKVVSALNDWENEALVKDAIDEIIDVHSPKRYEKFSALSQEEVVTYLSENFKNT
ncbi:HEAT repeat domain-containing protein [Aureisphaera galaxeae]|uniref:HEAT repeat domain-containing protein n=1 Tax=Aureisphaera galaxeae TaxID=1538023 RepID=UPI0023506B05|nr:HEAT repeat domain-containing protein [Aureisphaera galaxeae]MDC8003588.1 HEAT repeat domain-containing protein [Aureisphaera galaxeae]